MVEQLMCDCCRYWEIVSEANACIALWHEPPQGFSYLY